jgi:L-amino acid N-acyltransferase YncA
LNFTIETLREHDWPQVRRIYGEGLRTGVAAFARTVPQWEAWNRGHLKTGRFVASDAAGRVVAWAALSAVPDT